MTVLSTQSTAGPFVGISGTQTEFPFSIRVFIADDLRLTRTDANEVDAVLSLGTDYTVTLYPGNNDGYVVLASPLPVDYTLLIERVLDVTQEADFINAGAFYPEVIENGLDKLTMLIQQVGVGGSSPFGVGSGEANTASNLGSGAGVFASKVGVDLGFKSLVAGAGISLSQGTDSITITSTASGAGEINTASNLGSGAGVFASKVGVDLGFKSLVAGTGVTLGSTSDTITISASATGGGDAYLANTQTFSGVNSFSKGIRNNVAKEDKFVLKGNGGLYDWNDVAFKDVFFAVDVVDDRSLGNLEHSHSAMFNFRYTGSGTIGTYNGEPQSLSFSAGLLSNTEKWGSGSGHAFTANVTVMNTTGYAEGGGFQGVVTNTSSFNGTINYLSLFEGIVKDSGLATHMSCAALRVVKDNMGSTGRTHAITVSGEGAGTIDAVLALNPSPGATNRFNTGFDLYRATLTSGRAMIMPNNSNLSWAKSDGSVVPNLFLGADNIFRIKCAGYGTYEGVAIVGADDAFRITCDNYSASDPIAIFCGGSLRRVGVGALNSGGTGFRALVTPN